MRLVFYIIFLLFFGVYFFRVVIEPVYVMLYRRPVYVHLYIFPKRLPDYLKAVLTQYYPFYASLTSRKKKYFEHRVQAFINHYRFVPRNGMELTEEVMVKIAATSVLLTFGMRKHLYDVFKTILVYPDVFLSQKGDVYHKGEFNPAAGSIAFSWKDFEEGIKYGSDNLNLGLHEFAHALHFDALSRRRPGTSSVIYRDGYNKILKYIDSPVNREKIISEEYFRGYAYTNQFEFIAVMLEYFFETPQQFRQKLPELYGIVKNMINYK